MMMISRHRRRAPITYSETATQHTHHKSYKDDHSLEQSFLCKALSFLLKFLLHRLLFVDCKLGTFFRSKTIWRPFRDHFPMGFPDIYLSSHPKSFDKLKFRVVHSPFFAASICSFIRSIRLIRSIALHSLVRFDVSFNLFECFPIIRLTLMP